MKVSIADMFDGDKFELKISPESEAEAILLKLLESRHSVEFDYDSTVDTVVMYVTHEESPVKK